MRRETVTWVCAGLLAAGCANNTVDAAGNGRLLLLLDMPPQVSGRALRVRAEVENHDPVELVICASAASNSAQLCRLAEAPLDWDSVRGQPLDLLGDVIEGGSEVRFEVRDNEFDENGATFHLDGNTTIRLWVENTEIPGNKHVQVELTVQQALF